MMALFVLALSHFYLRFHPRTVSVPVLNLEPMVSTALPAVPKIVKPVVPKVELFKPYCLKGSEIFETNILEVNTTSAAPFTK